MRATRHHRRQSGQVTVALLALSALLSVTAACGGTDQSSTTDASTAPDVSEPVSTDGDELVRTTDATDAGTVEPPATAASTTDSIVIDPPAEIPVVVDTGVPGIDSTDAFCRSWSEFAGSFQALSLVAAIGDPDGAILLEVIAAPAMVAAVDGLDEFLPDELESERRVLLDDFVGPLYRRAESAVAELAAAGVTDHDALRSAWLEQLTAAGVGDPEFEIALPDHVDAEAIDAARTAFASQVPTIARDPSLVTDAAVPATLGYLSANCPDGGTLAGGDIL